MLKETEISLPYREDNEKFVQWINNNAGFICGNPSGNKAIIYDNGANGLHESFEELISQWWKRFTNEEYKKLFNAGSEKRRMEAYGQSLHQKIVHTKYVAIIKEARWDGGIFGLIPKVLEWIPCGKDHVLMVCEPMRDQKIFADGYHSITGGRFGCSSKKVRFETYLSSHRGGCPAEIPAAVVERIRRSADLICSKHQPLG